MPETIPAKLKMSMETWRGQYPSVWTTAKSLLMGTLLKKKWPDCFVSSWNCTHRSRGYTFEFNCCILWSNIFRYTAKHQQSVQDFLRKAEMEWNWWLQILNHNSYKRLKIKRNICSKFSVSSGAACSSNWLVRCNLNICWFLCSPNPPTSTASKEGHRTTKIMKGAGYIWMIENQREQCVV